ncbi:MAG: serine/threonine-protein kinase Pkn1(), partial [uncultured Gemmatimonadaceae bacterium]
DTRQSRRLDARRLRHPRPGGGRGHRRGVPRGAPRTRQRGHQGAARPPAPGRHRRHALSARGEVRRARAAPERGAHDRDRRGGARAPLPRHRVGRRRAAGEVRQAQRPAPPGRDGRDHRADRRRRARRARAGDRAPRPQAGERDVRPGRAAGEAARLRHRGRHRRAARRAPHAGRLLRGHAALRRARGAERGAGHPGGRPVQPRDDRLLPGVRLPALQRQEPARALLAAPLAAPGALSQDPPRRAHRAERGAGDHARARQAAVRALPRRLRLRRRALGRPRRAGRERGAGGTPQGAVQAV